MEKQNLYLKYAKTYFLEVHLLIMEVKPLEAARYGCCVFHGPHVSNFKEIYEHLQKKRFHLKSKIKTI